MPYKFNNDHQPEAADFDENYSDPRETRRIQAFWPPETRQWRPLRKPEQQPRLTMFQRIFGTTKKPE